MTLASASLLVSSCGGSDKGGCTLTGHTSFTEYTTACVTDLDRNLILTLEDPKDSLNNMSMPFIVEAGEIRMDLDEYIRISGTPLNRGVQEFLDGLQTCKDAVMAKQDLTAQDIRDIFSDYYKQLILLNKDNALGRYIYHDYGSRLVLPPEPQKQ